MFALYYEILFDDAVCVTAACISEEHVMLFALRPGRS